MNREHKSLKDRFLLENVAIRLSDYYTAIKHANCGRLCMAKLNICHTSDWLKTLTFDDRLQCLGSAKFAA